MIPYRSATEPCTPSLDAAIAALSARQGGRISTAQLTALGMPSSVVAHRLRAGRLHRVARGVYAVGHPGRTVDGHLWTAVLAAGDGTFVAARSAVALWGFGPAPAVKIDLLTAHRGRRAPSGTRLLKTRSLPEEDRAQVRGLPVTSVARTLVDLAAVVHPDRLAKAVHEADVARLLDVRAVERVLDRSAGRKGTGILRDVLQLEEPPDPNELQRRFEELCASARIEAPLRQVAIGPYVVDFLWPEERLVVETDGRVHALRGRYETDRVRDVELAKRGFHVARFTWRRIRHEPEAVAADVAALLELRRRSRSGPLAR